MYVRTCIVTVLGRSLIISRTSSLPAATAASDPRNFIINNYGQDKIKLNKIQVYGWSCTDHVQPINDADDFKMKEYVKDKDVSTKECF